MKLETEKGVFHAHFWHHNLVKPKADGTPRKKVHMATDVVLHPGACKLDENKRCTIEGVRAEARQHTRLDTFNKKVGRVVALDRALRGVTGEFLPRAVRTQIWNSYFKQADMPEARGSRAHLLDRDLEELIAKACRRAGAYEAIRSFCSELADE